MLQSWLANDDIIFHVWNLYPGSIWANNYSSIVVVSQESACKSIIFAIFLHSLEREPDRGGKVSAIDSYFSTATTTTSYMAAAVYSALFTRYVWNDYTRFENYLVIGMGNQFNRARTPTEMTQESDQVSDGSDIKCVECSLSVSASFL